MEIKCKTCGLKADEIRSVVINAKIEGMTPDEFIQSEEGTYNKKTGLFYCNTCYIEAGMPLGTA